MGALEAVRPGKPALMGLQSITRSGTHGRSARLGSHGVSGNSGGSGRAGSSGRHGEIGSLGGQGGTVNSRGHGGTASVALASTLVLAPYSPPKKIPLGETRGLLPRMGAGGVGTGAFSGLNSGAGTNTGADSGSGADTGADSRAGANTEVDSRAGADTGADSRAGTNTGADSRAGADTEVDSGAGANTEVDSGAGANTGADSRAGADSLFLLRFLFWFAVRITAAVGLGLDWGTAGGLHGWLVLDRGWTLSRYRRSPSLYLSPVVSRRPTGR